jgi:hypothetical protein
VKHIGEWGFVKSGLGDEILLGRVVVKARCCCCEIFVNGESISCNFRIIYV